ncbi:MAG: hypothetical protein JXB60_10150 [Candidatus Cloacimonetes bacterium]|nr:hypothetical protein [Candidatus Cloacimonadota bacterium]
MNKLTGVSNKKTRLKFFVLGYISITSQTLLLRELLIQFNGNEIVYMICLSLWLFLIASGSILAKIILRSVITASSVKLLLILLPFLQLACMAAIPLLVGKLNPMTGIMVDIPLVFIISLIVLMPGCIILGMLFPLICHEQDKVRFTVIRGYIGECLGMVSGGLALLLILVIDKNFLLLALVQFLSMMLTVVLFGIRKNSLLLLLYLLFVPIIHGIYLRWYHENFKPQQLIYSQDSRYGRLDVTSYGEQKNYYWDGHYLADTYSRLAAEQFIGFIMLQHPAPRDILVAGGLLSGYIEEIKSYPDIGTLAYTELDNNIISQYQAPSNIGFIRKELQSYLRSSTGKYDLIIIDYPDPASIFLNRYYTREFFRLISLRLKDKNSLLAITLSSGGNYITEEYAGLYQSVYQALHYIFPATVIIPAQKNILLGSNGDYLTQAVEVLTKRMQDRHIRKDNFNAAVIFSTCNELRIDQIKKALHSEQQAILNTVKSPRAYQYSLLLWIQKLGYRISNVYVFVKKYRCLYLASILLLTFIITGLIKTFTGSPNYLAQYQIFSISYINFVMQLLLIYIFQTRYGSVYFIIFIFTMTFMLGATLGFHYGMKINLPMNFLFIINIMMILFLFLAHQRIDFFLIIFIFNFLIAALEGVLLTQLLHRSTYNSASKQAVSFYSLDSMGAMFGGLCFSVLLFPLFDLNLILIFLIGLLLINMILSSVDRKYKSW